MNAAGSRNCTKVFKLPDCTWRFRWGGRRPAAPSPIGLTDDMSDNGEGSLSKHEHLQSIFEPKNSNEEREIEGMETWDFEEDTYTLGLVELVNKGIQGSAQVLVVVIATFVLQLFLFVKIYAFLSKRGHGDGEGPDTGVLVSCMIMAGLVLSGEVLEGLQKVIFAWRGFTGQFANVACRKILSLCLVLGAIQMMIGLFSFLICLQLVVQAGNVVDAFSNFIALSFVSDIDNGVLSSGIGQELFALEPSLQMIKVTDFNAKMNAEETQHLRNILSISIMILTLPPSSYMCSTYSAGLDTPVQLNWFIIIPSYLVAVYLVHTFWSWCSRNAGNTMAAIIVIVMCGLGFSCVLICRHAFGRQIVPELVTAVWFGYVLLLVPTTLALQEHPHLLKKVLVPHILLLLAGSAAWFDALTRFGCI